MNLKKLLLSLVFMSVVVVYFIPMFLIGAVATVVKFISDIDITNGKIVQFIIYPLVQSEKLVKRKTR